MHKINVLEKALVPEGKLYCVTVGCQTYFSTDTDFVSSWLTKYLKDPQATEKEWYSQPWNQDMKVAEAAQCPANEAARPMAEAAAAPRGLDAVLGRR